MAIFSNQATLTLGDVSIRSNVAYGELLDTVTVTKTAVESSYTPEGIVTYVVTLRNTGTVAMTGLTLTDDLGGYSFGTDTLYPLDFVEGSALVFADGVPQATPAVTAGPPLTVRGLTVSPGGSTVLVYQARVTGFAYPGQGGTIDNTVAVSGGNLPGPVTATETIAAAAGPRLTITKSIAPAQVSDNDRVTYTFLIQNSGSTPVVATDDAVITDLFNPILTDLEVSFDGNPWTRGIHYTYNEATGLFATLAGRLTVPAATYTQDPITGAFSLTPGAVILTVSGII